MIQYVHLHEPDPVVRQQLIDCYCSMWTVDRLEDFFKNGIVSESGGFSSRSVIPETRVVASDIQAFPDIYKIFRMHQFVLINKSHGEFSRHITRELYAFYAAVLMNFVIDIETTKRGQKAFTSTWRPLNSIVGRGKSVDIAKATINRMLHGPEYTAPPSICLFKGKHHAVTSETEMEDPTSRERVMHWIVSLIASEGENAVWVKGTQVQITKASVSFPTKVWWPVVRAQLQPTANYNTLSPSLASLVACLMAGYLVIVR
ncbi:hypothetical protein KY284_005172 [Solanum tuberosum]|nr:hypothetical protein KY284_005172 [Solanum tuberosum]